MSGSDGGNLTSRVCDDSLAQAVSKPAIRMTLDETTNFFMQGPVIKGKKQRRTLTWFVAKKVPRMGHTRSIPVRLTGVAGDRVCSF